MTDEQAVRITAGTITLDGDLTIPRQAQGLVIFAHGSGSSRHSRRNRAVAAALQERGLATLLMDLLTRDEESVDVRTAHLRFDLPLLAARLVHACAWATQEPTTRELPVCLFGASTGGGAALVAAARRPDLVRAVVSRGGRPDLAEDALPAVRAPVLLIVGEYDQTVLQLNEQAKARMLTRVELVIVPRATHLFEESGALEAVARLAGDWLLSELAG